MPNPADFIANHSRSLEILIKEHGVELRSFPDDVMLALGVASQKVLADAAAADPLTAKVGESYLAFLDEVAGWTEQSEQAYLRARSLVRAAG